MSQKKTESALSAALRHLEDSMAALSKNDERTISDLLWSASAETEYAVFLLSLRLGDKAERFSWKQNSALRSMEFKSMLTAAFGLLRNAEANNKTDNIEECYENAWTARNILLKAQESLEKKREKARTKTT